MADPTFRIGAVDDTKAAFASVTRNVGALRGALATLGIGVSLGAIAASFKSIIDQAENFNKLSQKTGIAVESLSAYSYAAKLTDTSNEELGVGLRKLAVNMTAAAAGGKEQAAIFKALDISVKDTAGNLKSTDTVLGEVADKFASFRDGAEKTALAVELFGRSGEQLIPFLNNFRELTNEGRKFGAVYTTEFAKAAEQFNDDLKRIAISAEAAKVQFFGQSGLIRGMSDWAAAMVEANRISGSLTETLRLFVFNLDAMTSETPRQEIERLTKALKDFQAAGAVGRFMQSPTGAIFGGREEDLKKQIEFLKFLERQQALSGRTGAAFEDARDIRARMGSIALQSAPVVAKAAAGGPDFADFLKTLRNELAKTEAAGNKVIEVQEIIRAGTRGAASGPEARQALALAAEINQRQSLTRAIEAEAEARRKDQEEIESYNRTEAARLDSLAEKWKRAADPAREYYQTVEEINRVASSGRLDPEQRLAAIEAASKASGVSFVAAAENVNKVNEAAQELGLVFTSAFGSAIAEGAKLSDILKGLGRDIEQIAAKVVILQPLEKALTGIFSKLLTMGGGSLDMGQMIGQGMMSASGAAFGHGGVRLFGRGGVVGGPSLFKFAGGIGMMGEAGPEGILPLRRGRSGRLGVESSGGGGVTVNVIGAQGPVKTRARQDTSGLTLDLIVGQISQQQASDIGSGRGTLAAMLERTYGLSRVPGSFR